MRDEVVDTNVLTIASAPSMNWVHPRIPLAELRLVMKVLRWVQDFRADDERRIVLDVPGHAILSEYKSQRNMPDTSAYGRQVLQHKFDRGLVRIVELQYLRDGEKLVAKVPDEVAELVHDNDDWKMLAAAFLASAPLVNACDSDWSNPAEQQALALLGVKLEQILTDEERAQCRSKSRRG